MTKIIISRIITIPFLFTLAILRDNKGRFKNVCIKTHVGNAKG